MEHLARRVSELAESATIKMSQLARELKEQGNDVISLSLGEPDFDTPDHIIEAGIQALRDGHTHYTPVPGYAELREAIAAKLKRDNGLEYSANQVVVSTGAKQSIINVVLSLVDPGDEVIVPIPYWVSYEAMVHLAEGKMVTIESGVENDFKITPEQLEKAITDKTRLMIFSSPCNPSGSVYTKDELEGLAKVIARYPNFYVVSDEIYEHINFGGKHESIAQFPEVKDQIITVNGFSKGFAMTGWRLGYIAAPLWIAKGCSKIQGQFTSGANAAAQIAAVTAMNSDLSTTYAMREKFLERRDIIVGLMREIPGLVVNVPQGAFYIFPDVSHYFGMSYEGNTIKDADDLAMYLLKEAFVSTVSGAAFGDPNCIRISYAASEAQIRESVKRISEALAKLG